jgi:hypothetical protein
VRRVPRRYTAIDGRGIVRMTTHIRIADDPHAVRAAPIAILTTFDIDALTLRPPRAPGSLLESEGAFFAFPVPSEHLRRANEIASRQY